jgi:phosphomannomutase
MKPLVVSMSGTRGIIGENLHPDVALKTAMAFGTYLKKGPVILGGDTRVSYLMLKNSIISGLLAVGIDVIDIGQVPTPTVQQLIKTHNAAGGIVITASHNPIMWNGIKLMSSSASFMNPQEYENYQKVFQAANFPLATYDKLGQLKQDTQALEKHIDQIIANIDIRALKKSRLKILVDPNNGTGALANPLLFKKLGLQYDIINAEPNGLFTHDPEPLEKNLHQIKSIMQKGSYDIGFVQDADADRLVILDENGRFIGEDYSLAFCMDHILATQASTNSNVVVNLSTSRLIEWLAQQYGAKVTYTKIGEPYVTHKIKELNALVGGEGNGGVIYPKVGWGRDSLVGIVIALTHLATKKQTVSQIISTYPKYTMLRHKFEVNSKEEINTFLEKIEQKYASHEIIKLDGVKVIQPNTWIHVRPSNTEPIIRIFIEGPDQKTAEALLNETLA